MGRLVGFNYRKITKKLKKLGFVFNRQAAGSHEIWHNLETNKYTLSLITPVICLKEGTLRAILKQADVNLEEFLS